jgi:CRISPR-associated protein Csd1
MMLAALDEYYHRLQSADDRHRSVSDPVAPLGFSVQKIAFSVVLDWAGALEAIEDERQLDPNDKKGKKKLPRFLVVPGGAKPTGSGINPCLLWDNPAYMLGYAAENSDAKRALESFSAFRQRHLELEKEIDDKHFSVVCRFLENWQPQEGKDRSELAEIGPGFGVFRVRGQTEFVHDRPAVKRYWLDQLNQRTADESVVGQCLVSGVHGRLARIHEPKIKGVFGAQSSGATLVSFNFPATESYGKEQSYNAPVNEESAFRYANALNHLLRNGSRQRVLIGDATTVFWTAQPTAAEDEFGIVFQPLPEDEAEKKRVEAVLKKIGRADHPGDDFGDSRTPFYVLGLSGNAARLSVRFWHVSTLGDMLDKIRRHFADLAMDGRAAWEPEFPSIQNILDQTARERKDVPPLLGGAIMRSILDETPYPHSLYAAVLRRIRADRIINYVRAATLKAYLNRNHRKEVPMSLDPSRPETSYHLGRLFAALEKLQEDALPELNDTIRDRYFGAASATPSTVFPRLMRLKQHHVGKLDNKGHRIAHEKRIQDIMDRFDAFPAHLNLQDQGLFAIGYYHQRKDLFTKKQEQPTT